jgi:hypothetical protein
MTDLANVRRERPIIFTADSVRAILAGSKTQTRRVIKPQPPDGAKVWHNLNTGTFDVRRCSPWYSLKPTYGVPGDRLWVREAWAGNIPPSGWIFKADGEIPGVPIKWLSPMFMARTQSRITLEITEVRVQRVQEISGSDAEAEGVALPKTMSRLDREADGREGAAFRLCFSEIWDSINAKRGYSWGSNPWVWALTFRRLAQ